jgi:hypothetical protein
LTPESAIPVEKNLDLGSGRNISDHISDSLVSILGLKILKFFVADSDPGSRHPVPFSLLIRDRIIQIRNTVQYYILQMCVCAGDEYTWLEYARKPSRRDIGSRMLYRDAHMTGWAYKADSATSRVLHLN